LTNLNKTPPPPPNTKFRDNRIITFQVIRNTRVRSRSERIVRLSAGQRKRMKAIKYSTSDLDHFNSNFSKHLSRVTPDFFFLFIDIIFLFSHLSFYYNLPTNFIFRFHYFSPSAYTRFEMSHDCETQDRTWGKVRNSSQSAVHEKCCQTAEKNWWRSLSGFMYRYTVAFAFLKLIGSLLSRKLYAISSFSWFSEN
jgi:hypothetical protein